MIIGRHQPKLARDTDLAGAVRIGFDEAFTALEESFSDLDDAQVFAFPIRHRNNIAWTVMHTLQNLDEYGNQVLGSPEITGKAKHLRDHAYRWGLWQCAPEERPQPGEDYPGVEELLAYLTEVRAQVEEVLSGITDEQLARPVGDWPRAADAAMRTIWHTMTHVRQIWLLRGALGVTDGEWWPRQHWA
jgi:hypothetical protein